MSAQHTPGPWKVGMTRDSVYADGNKAEGRYGFTLCNLGGIYPEKEANARLIAAAPDLLALLVRALPAVRTWAGMVRRSNGTHSAKSADADNLVHEIRVALAKVRP